MRCPGGTQQFAKSAPNLPPNRAHIHNFDQKTFLLTLPEWFAFKSAQASGPCRRRRCISQIVDVIYARGTGGFFYDDQAAIRRGAKSDGFVYLGQPLTPGFSSIRIPAQSLSVGCVLSDGTIVWGDMMSVQYSGASGRDPLFDADGIERQCRSRLSPTLTGFELDGFRDACARLLADPALPFAVRYGASQALLRAVAHARRSTMAEVICSEFALPLPTTPVPIYAQSGDARAINIDKMILKRVDVLPHGLINSREKFGARGEIFREFVRSVVSRIGQLGGESYRPILHFDVYGWIGLEIGEHPDAVADFIATVAEDAKNFQLQIESPADYGSRQLQLERYVQIVERLRQLSSPARIAVDEHCNTLEDVHLFASERAAHVVQIKTPDVGSIIDTIEAVFACKQYGLVAYVGGSCAETDLSAQVSVHVAVATQADMMLAKPGMGVDEAISIVGNEQNRLLATLARNAAASQGARLGRPASAPLPSLLRKGA